MRNKLKEKLNTTNMWRRGADIPMPSPKEFGEAIDDCIKLLERMSDEQFKELMNGKGIDTD